MPIENVISYYNGGLHLGEFDCRTPWRTLNIGAKGDVCPCFIQNLGNVRNESLSLIWNGLEMRKFRKRLKKGLFHVCQGCCNVEYKKR